MSRLLMRRESGRVGKLQLTQLQLWQVTARDIPLTSPKTEVMQKRAGPFRCVFIGARQIALEDPYLSEITTERW